MYDNILVPVLLDNEHNPAGSVRAAKALASDGARITFLHVIEQIPAYVHNYLPEDFRAEARKSTEAKLRDMAQAIPGAGSVVIEGHSGRSILDWGREQGCDLIVVASHRPSMQDLFIGSTAAHVVRHAPCAVHVLR